MEKELTTTTSTVTSAIDFLMILPVKRISSFLCQKRGQVAISASLVLDVKTWEVPNLEISEIRAKTLRC